MSSINMQQDELKDSSNQSLRIALILTIVLFVLCFIWAFSSQHNSVNLEFSPKTDSNKSYAEGQEVQGDALFKGQTSSTNATNTK